MYITIRYNKQGLTAGKAYKATQADVLGVQCYSIVDDDGNNRYIENYLIKSIDKAQ